MLREEFVPSAYLVMTNIDPEEWCVPFTEQRQVIGRGQKADIRILPRFTFVSRRHAVIWADGGRIKIQDLGSRSGTRVNGVWINDQREATLEVGDRIWMGGLELEVADQISLMAQVLAETGSAIKPAVAETEVRVTANEMAISDAEFPENTPGDTTVGGSKPTPTSVRSVLRELSQAELEVVLWMGRGCLDDLTLGQRLFRSPNTVRTHVNSIFRKLSVHSRTEVVACLKRVE